MTTDIHKLIEDLDGGVVEQKISAAISEVASSVIDNGGTGMVALVLSIKQNGTGAQVMVSAKLQQKRPTLRGSVSSDDTTATPMHVGKGGKVTLFAEQQGDMFHVPKRGEVDNG